MTRDELLIVLRSIEAMGMHEHHRTGLIPRTPGILPEDAIERVDQYAREFAIAELTGVFQKLSESYKPFDDKVGTQEDDAFNSGIIEAKNQLFKAVERLKKGEE